MLNTPGKRGLYIGIQDKSVVAGLGSHILPYRTGYELVLPYKVDDKYCTNAEKEGVVKESTSKHIIISYKDGTVEKYRKCKWVSKETGGKTYAHNMVSMFVKGDKVSVGDNILYDENFFAPDYMNRYRVAYKMGSLATIAMTEGDDSYEDSSNVSKHYTDALATPLTTVKDKVIPLDIILEEFATIGDKVTYNDNLVEYRNTAVQGTDMQLSTDSRAILEDITANKFKAECKGHVIKMEVIYNIDQEIPLDKSVEKFLEYSDKLMKEEHGLSGSVDSTYSIKGKPLKPNTMYVKYYVEKTLSMSSGDKFRVGNQLKTTAGSIVNAIVTEDGTLVDLEVGKRGVDGRIVSSIYYQGTVNLLLLHATKKAVEAYDN